MGGEPVNGVRAGAAHIQLIPPLGLPMIGFVRQEAGAQGYGIPLEAGALVLESGATRIVLCGVDVVGLGGAECNALVDRVADVTDAEPEGVLLNWSHTHLAPPAGPLGVAFGGVEDDVRASAAAYSRVIADTIVSVCRLAADRLEPAAIVWGQAEAGLAVNRRERTPGGPDGDTILGWNPDELVDNQVTVLQARRPDESPIATLVGYGCHPVTANWNVLRYSADFPGPMRRLIRGAIGGECIFFQGSGGNVLPRFSFTDGEDEAQRFGAELGIAALAAMAGRRAFDLEITSHTDRSATPYRIYNGRAIAPEPAVLACAREIVTIPLMPHPSLEEVEELRTQYEADLEAAKARGEARWIKVAYYWAAWARTTAAQLRDGTAPTSVTGPIHAVRIGDGAIVTGPGETFSEYGIAVKERSPATPTLYCGYTNGLLGYLPTAAEYAFNGYEAGYGHKGAGLPSLFEPAVERICVATGVRLSEQLFPAARRWDDADGWNATGELPVLAPPALIEHPSRRPTTVD